MDIERCFGGVGRLYGVQALAKFTQLHVVVVGMGGVGSWAAEALARSGIGALTLVDLDHSAASNINRQLHATHSTLGAAKVQVMAQRLQDINPQLKLTLHEDFVSADNVQQMLTQDSDAVLECTDDVNAKVALALWARTYKIPLFMAGAAGGRSDATRIKLADLAQVSHDRLLRPVRQALRRRLQLPPKQSKATFDLPCVYSDETPVRPEPVCAGDTLTGLNCAGYGASVCVTACFGFVLAGALLRAFAHELPQT